MDMAEMNTSQRIKARKPIEVWRSYNGTWTWEVYKKYQKPEKEVGNPYARWFCKVYTPIVPEDELGDVYVSEIKKNASKVSGGKMKNYMSDTIQGGVQRNASGGLKLADKRRIKSIQRSQQSFAKEYLGAKIGKGWRGERLRHRFAALKRGGKYKAHKGIYYFPSYQEAKKYAIEHNHPSNRIIEYERGWAIQKRISGPYVGNEKEFNLKEWRFDPHYYRTPLEPSKRWKKLHPEFRDNIL